MTTIASTIQAYCIDACRVASVATAAGVDSVTWASTTAPRVFANGTQGRPHRLCMPCVEVSVGSMNYDGSVAAEGGQSLSTAILMAHALGDEPTARALAHEILSECARQVHGDDYAVVGSDLVESLAIGPRWHRLTMQMTLEHTYDLEA